MKCPICEGKMKKIKDSIKQDNIEFDAYKCFKCGEELMNMKQLKGLAKSYRELSKSKEVKFSKWGNSLGIRIPVEYAKELKLHDGKSAYITKQKDGLKIKTK